MNEIQKTEQQLLTEIKSQAVKIKTPYDLVRIKNPDIADENNKGLIIQMIIELNQFTGVARKMTPDQIADTVNMLLDEYPRLSLQEYQVFFNKVRSGYFGQLYDSLDGVKIMVFMKQFYEEMVKAYNEFKEEDHYQIKVEEQHRDL